jgi:ABC-type Fe3+/spermidine/putrescine transport system ATPase subunit
MSQAPPARPLVDIRLEGLAASGTPPLRDVSLHVRYGEFFSLLGPPASGKTAVLRAVAGFVPLTAGRVLVDGQDVRARPVGARGMGFVFQEGALWPHLTARNHVAFGLEAQKVSDDEVRRRTAVVLGRLGLADVADRRPSALALEQRRRLALARALAGEPRVLLLDEPLTHLEPLVRKALRIELARLHRDLAVTTIQATRDPGDALALSDRLAVIADGRILQVGEPADVYRRPVSRTAATALGPATFLPVHVVEVRDLGVVVATERGDRVPVAGLGTLSEGSRGLLVLRPDMISLTETAMARGPGIAGTVRLRLFEGARYLYEVDVGTSAPVRVEVPAVHETRMFRVGESVRVEMSSETVVLVPDDR